MQIFAPSIKYFFMTFQTSQMMRRITEHPWNIPRSCSRRRFFRFLPAWRRRQGSGDIWARWRDMCSSMTPPRTRVRLVFAPTFTLRSEANVTGQCPFSTKGNWEITRNSFICGLIINLLWFSCIFKTLDKMLEMQFQYTVFILATSKKVRHRCPMFWFRELKYMGNLLKRAQMWKPC